MHPKLHRFVTLIRMSVTSRPKASTSMRSLRMSARAHLAVARREALPWRARAPRSHAPRPPPNLQILGGRAFTRHNSSDFARVGCFPTALRLKAFVHNQRQRENHGRAESANENQGPP